MIEVSAGVEKGRGLMKEKVRIGVAVLITAVLFALYMSVLNYFEEPVWKPLLVFALLLGLFAAACIYLPCRLPAGGVKWLEQVKGLYHRAEEAVDSYFTDRGFFLQLWFLLFLVYLPAWISLFPGTFGYDAPIQIAEYFGDAGTSLASHHPLAHTFLMGWLFSLGEMLFHSYTAGFVLYMALQVLAVTGSLSYSLLVCRRCRVPLIWIMLGALWAALNPFLWVLTFTSTKDILFGAFLLCFSAALWEAAECVRMNRGHLIKLVVFGILVCLFRNQGIYILFALVPVCLLLRLKKRGLWVCLLVVCLVSQAFFSLSSHVLQIPEGDKREMLCVPMQQMARVCSAWASAGGVGDNLTQEQYEIVTELIPPEGMEVYIADAADQVKSHFRTEALAEDFGKYFSNYVEIGRRNPREYLLAWVDLIRPYWDMTSNEYKGLAFSYTFSDRNRWGIQRSEHRGIFERFFQFLYSVFQAPRYNVLWRPETCLWLLAALPGLALARRKKGLFLGVVPLGLYFGTAILGPVALLRYLYPLTLATPLLFGMVFQRKEAS